MRKLNLSNLLFPGIIAVLAILLAACSIAIPSRGGYTSQAPTPTPDPAGRVTQIPEVMPSAAAVIQPTQTPAAPAATMIPPAPTRHLPPVSFYIRDFIGNHQYYALGCEASAAVDLAHYYDVFIYQYDFQFNLPVSDNPDLGFVGDVDGPWGQIPPYAYGVHAAPVADLLNAYGVDVQGGKGYTLEDIRSAISQSHPVIVWVIGSMVYSEPVSYQDKLGNTTIVAPYEHVVVLTGYDEDSVRYINNGKYADVPNEVFLNSWGVLGNMAVFHRQADAGE